MFQQGNRRVCLDDFKGAFPSLSGSGLRTVLEDLQKEHQHLRMEHDGNPSEGFTHSERKFLI